MSFMPQGYEELVSKSSYISLSKLPEGEHRFRIVQVPVAGWVDWKEQKPYRFKPDAKPSAPFDVTKPIRAFWALYVWDYAKEGLFVMEVTQGSLLKALRMIGEDDEWGDFRSYDIKIRKKGSGMDTEYSLTPAPHKPMAQAITDALAASPVRLEALYDGGDPWKDLVAPATISTAQANEIDALISDDEQRKKILSHYKIGLMDELPIEAFAIVVKKINEHNAERLKK